MSLLSCKLGDDPNPYYVVGTGDDDCSCCLMKFQWVCISALGGTTGPGNQTATFLHKNFNNKKQAVFYLG